MSEEDDLTTEIEAPVEFQADPGLLAFLTVVESAQRGFSDDEEKPAVQLGVTLLVGGALVTGQLTAGKAWWRQLGEALRNVQAGPTVSSENAHEIGTTLADHVKELFEPIYDEPFEVGNVGHLHLVGGRVVFPGQTVPQEGTLLRIRLDRIDGWLLGEMSASAD